MPLFSLDSREILLSIIGWIAFVLWAKQMRVPRPSRHGESLRKPPNSLPILGNAIDLLQPRQKLFSWFVRCERLFGYETLYISVPTLPPGVIISSPENLDFVFRNEEIFQKGDFFKQRSRDLFGHGIINVDGHLWRQQRKAGLRFLSLQTLRFLTNERLPEYLDRAVELLKEKTETQDQVDLQNLMLEVTTQLMGKMAYNMELHADDDFTLAFEYVAGITAERVQNPLWFLTEFITGGAKLPRSIATIKAYGRRIVATAVAARAAHGTAQQQPSDVSCNLIQSLLDSNSDQDLAADAALNYLSAGRDTVAQALAWTFYFLIQYPHVTTKLRQSIQKVQETLMTSGCGGSEPLHLAGLFTPTRLPFALAIFYEVMRLRPPIPFETKQVEQSSTLPDGTFLPTGTVVVWCIWAMCRSHTTWGSDADDFRPERWLSSSSSSSSHSNTTSISSTSSPSPADQGQKDVTVIQRPPSEYPVFNGGPRACLGKKMAELVFVQTLARIVSEFDFLPAYSGERVSKSSLTLPMEGGLPVYVRRRERPRSSSPPPDDGGGNMGKLKW